MNTPAELIGSHTKTPLTERGRHLINRSVAVAGAAAIIGGGVAFVEAAHNGAEALTHPNGAQTEKNKSLITSADMLYGTPIILRSGVNVRLSPAVINGSDDGTPSNIAFNVKKGSDLIVSTAISDGDYIAFDRPGTTNNTLDEQASHLVYVNKTALQANSPDLIEVSSDVAGAVKFDGHGYEWSDDPSATVGGSMDIDSRYLPIHND